jgi:hypothetical protein
MYWPPIMAGSSRRIARRAGAHVAERHRSSHMSMAAQDRPSPGIIQGLRGIGWNQSLVESIWGRLAPFKLGGIHAPSWTGTHSVG